MSKPEDRYRNLKKKQLSDGTQVYRSAIPITIDLTDANEQFSASELDRMDILASNIYGSALDWWRIAAANKKVNGSIHFKPGQKVIIPKA
jgi:hypothetical protein